MPLLGKVPWELDTIPAVIPSSSEFWVVRFTGELFSKYEDYLKRIELYRDRVWTCKITEKSGLTFEEAALSEKRSSQKAESFPEYYLATFLNIVHLNTSTLGELVEEVYNFFKENYVVGEQIECQAPDSKEWKIGKIKEITNSSSTNGNGRHSSKEESVYKIELIDDSGVVNVSKSALRRKKFALTKEMVKQKIRQVATRDRYAASPWLVDIGLCRRYSLAAYDGISTAGGNISSDDDGDTDRPNKRQKTYPMEDMNIEREDNKKLPPPSTDFTVPGESVGDLLTAWHFIVSFSKGLQLSPFSLEDLEAALAHSDVLDLTDELHISLSSSLSLFFLLFFLFLYLFCFVFVYFDSYGHYRLLRVSFNQKSGGSLPKKDINKDTWPDVLQSYLEKFTTDKKPFWYRERSDDTSDTASQNTEDSSDSSDKEEEQTTTTNNNNNNNNNNAAESPEAAKKANLKRILEIMKKDSWYELEVADKVAVIKQLCDVALQTDAIRNQIEGFIEASIELTKEMKEQDLVDKKRKKEIEKERAKATTKAKTSKNSKTSKTDTIKGNGKDPEKEESSREAQKLARREEAMDKNNIRLISIGQDRFRNRYWYWNALYGKLFVERAASTSSWGYYSTKGELDALLEFLDERGIREEGLKAALNKKYNKMAAAMEKRGHEMVVATAVTEVRRSSRIKTTTNNNNARVDKDLPSFLTYVNKFS